MTSDITQDDALMRDVDTTLRALYDRHCPEDTLGRRDPEAVARVSLFMLNLTYRVLLSLQLSTTREYIISVFDETERLATIPIANDNTNADKPGA